MPFELRISAVLMAAGTVLLLIGLTWWWLVFREVIAASYMGYREAIVCVAAPSDLCSLAQALCRTEHVLGITRYSIEIFWMSLALLTGGVVLESRTSPLAK